MDAFGSGTASGSVADKFVYFRLSAGCGPWYGRLPRVANGVEGWSTCRPRGNGALYHGPQPAPASNTQFYQRGKPVRHRLRGQAGTCSDHLPALRSRVKSGDKWKGDLIAASRRGIWVCRITQPGSAELGNLKVHNRATTPCTAGQPGTLAHMILLNYWDSIERLSYALFGCPFMHFLLDKHRQFSLAFLLGYILAVCGEKERKNQTNNCIFGGAIWK